MPPVPPALETGTLPNPRNAAEAGGRFATLGNFGGFLPIFPFFLLLVFGLFRVGFPEQLLGKLAWNGGLEPPAVPGRGKKKVGEKFGKGEFQDSLHWGGHRDEEDSTWEHPGG